MPDAGRGVVNMCAILRIARAAVRLAVAGWVATCLSACAPSAIDADRQSFVSPAALAARAAARAELSVIHNRAVHELNIEAAVAPQPAGFRGAFFEAYNRWKKGDVRKLPAPSQAGQ